MVWLVLMLDAVSGRLGETWSGVWDVVTFCTNELDGEARIDPIEDIDAKDAAEAIAPDCDHASMERWDAADDFGCTSIAFAGKLLERGLVTTGDWVLVVLRGEPDSFMFRFNALLMLHFFEGVRGADGVAWLLLLSCAVVCCVGCVLTLAFKGDENT